MNTKFFLIPALAVMAVLGSTVAKAESDMDLFAVHPLEIREQVLTIATDAFDGSWTLDVIKNVDGSFQALDVRNEEGKSRLLTVTDLLAGPQLVKEVDGHEVIYLSAEPGFDAAKGGHVVMRYLQSGISGSYRNFRILVDNQTPVVLRSDPDNKDRESDRNRFTSVFNHLFLEKNTFFGRTIGISRVVPSMESSQKLR